jgi:hypothetical protein
MGAIALARIGQYGFRRFEIGVEITENRETHEFGKALFSVTDPGCAERVEYPI